MKRLLMKMVSYERSLPVIEVMAQHPDIAFALLGANEYWKHKDKELSGFRACLVSIKKQRKRFFSLHDNLLLFNGKRIGYLNGKEKQVFQEVSDNEAIS